MIAYGRDGPAGPVLLFYFVPFISSFLFFSLRRSGGYGIMMVLYRCGPQPALPVYVANETFYAVNRMNYACEHGYNGLDFVWP